MLRYTLSEEKANTITHAIGIPFGIAVFIFFALKNSQADNYWLLISTLVYAVLKISPRCGLKGAAHQNI
jgi:predicted membrane channel-forming protein YqfA (hemolysin III family)